MMILIVMIKLSLIGSSNCHVLHRTALELNIESIGCTVVLSSPAWVLDVRIPLTAGPFDRVAVQRESVVFFVVIAELPLPSVSSDSFFVGRIQVEVNP